MCSSMEARDGNVPWNVAVGDFFVSFFYESEIKLSKNAIKHSL